MMKKTFAAATAAALALSLTVSVADAGGKKKHKAKKHDHTETVVIHSKKHCHTKQVGVTKKKTLVWYNGKKVWATLKLPQHKTTCHRHSRTIKLDGKHAW